MDTNQNLAGKAVPIHGTGILEQIRNVIRLKHYSLRTEQTYMQWIKRFIFFNGNRQPSHMGEKEVSNFLTHLAVKGKVSASTQNQAFNAILFLYREVLKQKLGWIKEVKAYAVLWILYNYNN